MYSYLYSSTFQCTRPHPWPDGVWQIFTEEKKDALWSSLRLIFLKLGRDVPWVKSPSHFISHSYLIPRAPLGALRVLKLTPLSYVSRTRECLDWNWHQLSIMVVGGTLLFFRRIQPPAASPHFQILFIQLGVPHGEEPYWFWIL